MVSVATMIVIAAITIIINQPTDILAIITTTALTSTSNAAMTIIMSIATNITTTAQTVATNR